MSTYRIRPATEGDYSRIVAIRNSQMPEPTTLEEFQRNQEIFPPECKMLRWVAVDEEDYVLASAVINNSPQMKPGEFAVNIRVEKAFQKRGIGRALYRAVEESPLFAEAQRLVAEVRDEETDSLAWVERLGFIKEHHIFESTVELATFDPTPFADAVARVRDQGIRFTTLADEYPAEDRLRRHYEITWRLAPDIPSFEDRPIPSWEYWLKAVGSNPHFNPASIFLAMDGETCAGIAELTLFAGGATYNGFTGVDRAYRGRGIALALKAVALEWARGQGIPYVRTNNHSVNGPMLAVNGKLGYRQAPGFFTLYQELHK